MKYIIAPRWAVVSNGISPLSNKVTEGMTVLNENELRHRHPDKPLEELAAKVGGIIVSRGDALDFISKRKSFSQLNNQQHE